jgi:hypothetical protein
MVTMSTSDTQERTERIGVPVTPAEKRKFEKLAESRHTYLAVLIRQLLHRECDTPGNGRG